MSVVSNLHKEYLEPSPKTPFAAGLASLICGNRTSPHTRHAREDATPPPARTRKFVLHIEKMELLDEGITVISGPSGCGKSTLLRILMGLESCPHYSWEFKGINLADLNSAERRIGVVFQDYALFPHMSAAENIRFAREARGLAPNEREFDEIVGQLKLGPILPQLPHTLSGGEKQRVALARALFGEPRILFLDEPFANLDAPLRKESRELVKRMVATRGIPALLVTHDPEDIAILAQKTYDLGTLLGSQNDRY